MHDGQVSRARVLARSDNKRYFWVGSSPWTHRQAHRPVDPPSFVVFLSVFQGKRRRHHSRDVVWVDSGAEDEEKQGGPGILDMRDAFEEEELLGKQALQSRLCVVRMAKRRPKNLQASPVHSTHGAQQRYLIWGYTASTPHLGLASIDLVAGVVPKLLLLNSVNLNKARLGHDTKVAKKDEETFILVEPRIDGLQGPVPARVHQGGAATPRLIRRLRPEEL